MLGRYDFLDTTAGFRNSQRKLLRNGKHVRASILSIIVLAITALCGCETVPFYDRALINDPVMVFADDPTETHFDQKTAYSREGSVGGIGAGAGGGCGCY